jgi:hypothetical protein
MTGGHIGRPLRRLEDRRFLTGAPLGIEPLDMPATPERVWRAIQSARRADHSRLDEPVRSGGGSQPKTLRPPIISRF